MPLVSIITPTKDRQHFLPAIWKCIEAQVHKDLEWLVHDGSLQPASMFSAASDPRIRYFHEPKQMTIGAKRNALCQAARGEIVVQFDDDDYYAPHYVDQMLSFMHERGADFVKLFGFFNYLETTDTFAYWDLEYDLPHHWMLHAATGATIFGPYRGGPDAQWGYGFSYVFRRRVWQAINFPDMNHGEDHEFARAAIKQFKSDGMQDSERLCLHVLHSTNTSWVYPQRLLRRSQMEKLFPYFR